MESCEKSFLGLCFSRGEDQRRKLSAKISSENEFELVNSEIVTTTSTTATAKTTTTATMMMKTCFKVLELILRPC